MPKKLPHHKKSAQPRKVAPSTAKPKPTTLDILNTWTQAGYYVYLRAISSRWEASGHHKVVWKVQCEFRNMDGWKEQAQSDVTPDAAIREIEERLRKRGVKHKNLWPSPPKQTVKKVKKRVSRTTHS